MTALTIFKLIDGQSLNDFSQYHMPIWGCEFYGSESDDRKAHDMASR